MQEYLGLKHAAACTGQHLKWTSGARVMTASSIRETIRPHTNNFEDPKFGNFKTTVNTSDTYAYQ